MLFVALMVAGYYYNITFVQLGLIDLGTRLVGMSETAVSVWMAALALCTLVAAVATGVTMDRRGWSTNLRTYVTRGDHAGVYFFSLDARGILGVLGARLFHHLPYFYARISLDVDGNRVRFESDRLHPGARPARFVGSYAPTGDQLDVEPGSLAEFLTERYRYYTQSPSGALRYARIDHESWPLYEAETEIEENTLFEADGFSHPETGPVHYYSPGVTTIASPSLPV